MSSASTPWLLTGVTGGLGAKILADMLHVHHYPPHDIVATSRSEGNRARFEAQGLRFAVADYRDPDSLHRAFAGGVRNLLFMSSSQHDNATRIREHGNVIAAAKAQGVAKVWYVSLAFGGWEDTSKICFQVAHYATEDLLKASGLDFVSLRAGLYSDAFPLFLNWYPSSEEVLLPKIIPEVEQSRIAFTTRDELGEGMATLFVKGLSAFPSIQPKTGKNIILLTSTETDSLVDLVGAVNRGRATSIPIRYMEPQDWIEASAKDDLGGKGRTWFEARLVFTQGVCSGDAEVIDPALEILLGRKPETGVQAVERMVTANPGYTWHQNHMR